MASSHFIEYCPRSQDRSLESAPVISSDDFGFCWAYDLPVIGQPLPWPRLFKRLCDECGFTADQVDQLIFTQISKSSIAIAAERCNVPLEKCHTIMQKWGYTGSACIPMALDDAIELGKIKRGDLVVMISSGLGWNQAAAAIRWTM